VARAAIATIGRALASERPSAVFVGGTVTALYPLDGGVDVRPTLDVDCVVDLTKNRRVLRLRRSATSTRLLRCTDEGAPLCRLVYAGIRVHVVATTHTGIRTHIITPACET
jgi:hypothetical protein